MSSSTRILCAFAMLVGCLGGGSTSFNKIEKFLAQNKTGLDRERGAVYIQNRDSYSDSSSSSGGGGWTVGSASGSSYSGGGGGSSSAYGAPTSGGPMTYIYYPAPGGEGMDDGSFDHAGLAGLAGLLGLKGLKGVGGLAALALIKKLALPLLLVLPLLLLPLLLLLPVPIITMTPSPSPTGRSDDLAIPPQGMDKMAAAYNSIVSADCMERLACEVGKVGQARTLIRRIANLLSAPLKKQVYEFVDGDCTRLPCALYADDSPPQNHLDSNR